ncbi:MAG: ABC transporter permease [Chloroflexi bacterium]|nr:ABC transporter permease [Chloroflexota bacterium]
MIGAPIFVIARLTIREASRRRLLLAVVILTLVLIGATTWGFAILTSLPCRNGEPCSPIESKILAATLLILVAFMFSFILTLGAVFITAPAVVSEVESGVALAMLARPIRRSDVVIGKWLGLATILAGYTLVTTSIEFAAVSVFVGYTPPHPIMASTFLFAESLVMLTLALLCSTRLPPMTGGVVALILFGLAWIGGIARAVGEALGADTVRTIGQVTTLILPTDGLWRGALFSLEPSLLLQGAGSGRGFAANPFFAIGPPPPEYLAWAAAWVVAILGLAVFSFNRRQL